MSIINGESCLLAVLRTHTYRVEGTDYISNCEDGIIRTLNYYLTIDKNLEVTKSQVIDLIDKKPYESKVRGLEDVRLIDKDRIVGVSYEHIANEALTMTYYELKESEDGSKKIGDYPTVMKTHEFCEKNWLPIPSLSRNSEETETKFLYSLSPTRIASASGEIGIRKLWEYEQNFDDERGSSLMKYKFKGMDGYLVLTHRVIFLKTRLYLNRFFFLNSDYKILYSSTYFHFLHIGIEYCLGLCYSFNPENLYVAVSKSDKETFIVEFSKRTVEEMLTPIDEIDNSVFGVKSLTEIKEQMERLKRENSELNRSLAAVQEEVVRTNEELQTLQAQSKEEQENEEAERQRQIRKKIHKRSRHK
jgi:hypothetical protein